MKKYDIFDLVNFEVRLQYREACLRNQLPEISSNQFETTCICIELHGY